MQRYLKRASGKVAVFAAAGLVAMAACGDPKDVLLSAPDPDLINPADVNSPDGAEALRLGALGRLRTIASGGESVWFWGGLLTDEWRSGDTFAERNATDTRANPDNNGLVGIALRDVYRARTSAREALVELQALKPNPPANVAQMYMVLGIAETYLAENFCNGTPLSDASTGVPVYGPPMSNQAVFTLAVAHFDSALALASATDAASVAIKNTIQVAKGRALIDLGQFDAAAAAVNGVATSFRFDATHSLTGGNNQIWSLNTSAKRYIVGDSIDQSGALLKNALPFVSAKDPRVPTSASGSAFDTSSPFFRQMLFGRVDPAPIESGLDARLIEAEARLNANDIPGMMTILNNLRTNPPVIANFSGVGGTPGTSTPIAPTLPALAAPATKDAAVSLFFREKAFWTFGRGQRLGDLRRLIRQYGRTQDQVFPVGSSKGTVLGTDVNLPIHPDETNNTGFTACTDRKA